jgi:ribose-phosphate pyrophosphokinase
MDRRIAPGQPDTLEVFTGLLTAAMAHVDEISILDPHSPVTLARLSRARAIHPDRFVSCVLDDIEQSDAAKPMVVIPDQGAVARTSGILERIGATHSVARCSKKRDPNTGVLSGFQLDAGDVRGRHVVIVDDICDGGGTFTGIAEVLRSHGAKSVCLAVTHGIFSRGIELAYVDRIYSTDSYGVPAPGELSSIVEEAHGETRLIYRRSGIAKLVVMTDFVRQIIARTGTA